MLRYVSLLFVVFRVFLDSLHRSLLLSLPYFPLYLGYVLRGREGETERGGSREGDREERE